MNLPPSNFGQSRDKWSHVRRIFDENFHHIVFMSLSSRSLSFSHNQELCLSHIWILLLNFGLMLSSSSTFLTDILQSQIKTQYHFQDSKPQVLPAVQNTWHMLSNLKAETQE